MRDCGSRCSSAKRHKRGRGFGWSVLAYQSPDLCGLLEPGRNRRRAQALPALAGEAECRR